MGQDLSSKVFMTVSKNVLDTWEDQFVSFMKTRSRWLTEAQMSSELGNPYLFQGMPRLVERIEQARTEGQRVRVVGDYDADGVLSTALMVFALECFGLTVDYVVPDRFTEGYGIKPGIIEKAAADGIELVVTVDNGITALEAAQVAKTLGIDLIVTDHHLPSAHLPEAYVILDPHLQEETYPFPYLSGTSIALKVAQALLKTHVPDTFLAYAALSTFADAMPVIGENRTLIQQGMDALYKTRDLFLQKLLARFSFFETYERYGLMDYEGLQYRLIPLLNAPGRMGHAGWLVETLLGALRFNMFQTMHPSCSDHCNQWQMASEQANDTLGQAASWFDARIAELVAINDERKRLTEHVYREAKAHVQNDPLAPLDVVYAPDWHEGVVGIVASRLIEERKRPVFVLTRGTDGKIKGSARSTADFPLDAALANVREHLLNYGGHAQAAGLTLDASALQPFKEALYAYAAGSDHRSNVARSSDDALMPTVNGAWTGKDSGQSDIEDPHERPHLFLPLNALTLARIQWLYELAPFGEGNPKPILILPSVTLLSNKKLSGHALEWVVSDGSHEARILVFRQIDTWREVPLLSELNLLVDPGWSMFRGKMDVTLILLDAHRLRPYETLQRSAPSLEDRPHPLPPWMKRPRDGLKWLYQHVYQSGGTVAAAQLLHHAQRASLSPRWVAEWLDVFVDIGLVTWQGSEVRLCSTEEKRDLNDSGTYRMLHALFEKHG